MLLAALFTKAKIWKQPQCPTIDELGKKAVAHLYNGILHGCKKEGTPTFATARVDLEIIILNEIGQKERDKYHTISLVYRIY